MRKLRPDKLRLGFGKLDTQDSEILVRHGPKIGTESKGLICDNVERNNEVLRRDGLGADVCSTRGLTDRQIVFEHGCKVSQRVRGFTRAKTHGLGSGAVATQ